MIAGLEAITDGTITIGDRVVNNLSPKDRDIAMVFQNYALYPHLSVADNIAFGLRLRKTPKDVVEERIAWAAKLLDLTPYLARKPKELSGGQRQRVAMGRAIVREPQVFLMDEPLSNLDAKLRVQMRAEIAKLQHELDTTTIYVTHDQVEAMTMGDRVAVMSMGVLQQVDRPQQLYDAAAEPLRRELHRHAADEPLPRNDPDATTERSPSTLGSTTACRSSSRACALRRDPGAERPRRRCRHARRGRAIPPRPVQDLPTIDARVELVEALGSGVMAHFHVDVDAYRAIEARGAGPADGGTDDLGSPLGGALAGAAQPRRALPSPRRAAPGRHRSRSRSTPALSTSSTRRPVRRSGRSLLVVARSAARSCSRVVGGSRSLVRLRSRRPAPRSRRSRSRRRTARSPRSGSTSSCRTGTRTATRRTTAAGSPGSARSRATTPSTRLVPRRRPERAHRHVHRHAHGPRAGQGSRLHGDLGHARRRPAVRAGGQRGVPRLLGPRLHEGRPAPRHERRLRRVRRLRPLARDEGLPRRRRQPHRRRDRPGGRFELSAAPTKCRTATARASRSPRSGTRAASGSRASRAATSRDSRSCFRRTGTLKRPAWLNQVTRYHNRGDIDVRQLLARVLRAGRLLRARRHLHRAAVRRERARGGVRRRGSGSSRSMGSASTPPSTSTARSSARWAPKILAAARAAGVQDFEIFGEVFLTDAVELSSFVRDRAIPNIIDFPLQDRSSATRVAPPDRAASRPVWPTTTTSAGRPASRRRRRRSSATTTSAAPRRRSASRPRQRARSSSRG